MTDIINRIAAAQIKQEGAKPGSNNPGNIRTPVWLPKPWPMMGGFWDPEDYEQGLSGLLHIITLHVAEGDSLVDYIKHYAPPSENDTVAYVLNVAMWAMIPDIFIELQVYLKESPTGLTDMTMDQQIAQFRDELSDGK